MRRIKLRKKYIIHHKFSIGEKIVIILVLILLFLFMSFKYINDSATPVLMNYAEIEAKKFINTIINKSISEAKIKNVDDLINISKTNDQINTIDFNVNEVNSMLSEISIKIQDYLKKLDSGLVTDLPGYDNDTLKKGIIYEIPTGVVFKNNILSNLGPKIPIKISMRGSINSNIDTSINNYGINNAMVKVSVILTVDEQVLLPFTLKEIQVVSNIPIILKLIEGNVPKYYSGSMSQSSPILSFPVEEN